MKTKKNNLQLIFFHVAWLFLLFILDSLTPQIWENQSKQRLLLFIFCATLGHIPIAIWAKTTVKDWQVSFFMILIGIFMILWRSKGFA